MVLRAKSRSTKSRTLSANDEFLAFTSSVHVDHRLWKVDLAGSIAHATLLADAGLLTQPELRRMIRGLKAISREFQEGRVELNPKLEDIHMNIESKLIEETGNLGAKLHAGRSRNDQVALDMRLITRELIATILTKALALQSLLLRRAKENERTVLPGYTHLQHAQPVLLSHHLLAHFWRLNRDMSRLAECYDRTNVSPLGSGALAGAGFPLDRTKAADMLGMRSITENSLDSVSDRDFVAELVFALSLLMVHLSSLSEELINWSSMEFGFIRLPRSAGGGSSMMPQKLNPDIAELVRGKAGGVLGDLIAVLTMLKSLPLAYNRDLQEDKSSLFDAFDTAGASLHALTTLLAELSFDAVRMRKAAEAGLMTATDLADFLTLNGVPFRKAHGIVKEAAAIADGDDEKFKALASGLMAQISKNGPDSGYLELDSILARRTIAGGTSPGSVSKQMRKAAAAIRENEKVLSSMNTQIRKIDYMLAD